MARGWLLVVVVMAAGCVGTTDESMVDDFGLGGDEILASRWRPAPLFGGGYNTAVEYNPLDPSTVLLGTDIGGLHISHNGGVTWVTRARGGVAPNGSRVASIAWHPGLVDVAYALVGECLPGSGGLMISTNRGDTWTLASSLPVGCGNHTTALGTNLPFPHPRSIGALIAVDAVGRFIYVATARQGVMRASLGANGVPGTFSVVALAPSGGRYYYTRSIAMDDVDKTVLYVATHTADTALGSGRPIRIRNARTTADAAELSAAPRNVEELAVVDGHVYGVANDAGGAGVGLFRLASARTAATGASWRHINGPRYDAGLTWYSIAAQRRSGVTTVWLSTDGTWRPSSTVAWKHLWRGTSTDGFATDGTWRAFPDALTDTPNDVAGPTVVASPDRWWKLENSTYGWMGKDSGFTGGDFALHPTIAGQLIVVGQSGPWRTTDDGDNWYPIPNGINLLANVRMSADPRQAGRAIIGNVDYRALASHDGFHTGVVAGPPAGSSNDGWSLAWDTGTTPSTFYIGVGVRDSNAGGQVWTSQTPETGPWTQLMTATQTELGTERGRRPVGLAVVRDPSAPSTRIVIAALQEGRIWRKVGSGAWQPASGFALSGAGWPRPVTFAWTSGTRKLYAYERTVGLYRSDDLGASWRRILPSPSTGSAGQGFVAVDPANSSRVYLATGAWVKLVTNAGSAGTDGAIGTNLGFPGTPGAIGVHPNGGVLYVSTNGGSPARLYRGAIATGGTVSAWTELSDDGFYQMISRVQELSVGPDGAVYAPTSGGMLVLDP